MSSLETSMTKARSAEKRGDFAEAERLYGAVLQRFPGNARARKGMDALFKARALAVLKADAPPQSALDALTLAYREGRMAQVVSQAEALLNDHPRSALVHNLLGAALLTLGEPARAEAALRGAHGAGVRHPALCNNLGMAIARQGRHDEAATFYREAIALDPAYAIARNNLGNALKDAGRLDEALAAYDAALAIDPAYADARSNRALALDRLGRVDEARQAYRDVLALRPDHAAACNNLANLLAGLGDLAGALALYERALASDPAYAEAHLNLGNLHKRQGRLAEANAAYDSARAARPGYAEASAEQGKALALEGRLDAAIAAFGAALASDPGHAGAAAHKAFYQAHVCDWAGFDDWRALGERADTAISPFAALTFEDDPAAQLRRSRAWARARFPQAPAPLPRPAPAADGRIRIGYFSADFHDHATMHLMSGLLREHDRSRFAIHAFSYGPDIGGAMGGAMRGHLIAHADSFTDIRDMPDAQAAALARGLNLDIAVDLKGYTRDGRLRLFAQRLAPVQVGYLGYPGSSGADFIDYLVADPVVIPPAERAHYSESLILLPGSYQPNDNARPVAPDPRTRADHGLPERGFVFCAFNQSYKIGPREFAVWMRLLARVEGSVLWLLRSNPWAEAALRARAAEHGIAPDRLVFAPPLPQAEHLARHAHADLFVDCFAVNAHTTASDALWAGLPVVTLAGHQFAARVAASLLTAVGLPHLITETPEAYEALILDLATDTERLAEVKARLAANRESAALFDTRGYARALEQGFAEAHRRFVDGEQLGDVVLG
jgi:predicted O-linked N-acetylglucosamine transferase (SPINDLY family)